MNILIIRYSSLGDVILTIAAAKNIKADSMDNNVDILTKEEYVPILRNNRYIDNVITGISWKKKYDYVVDLHNSIRSNIVKHLIRTKRILTYNKASYARRLYVRTGRRSAELDETVIDRYLHPLKEIGMEADYTAPEIGLGEEELEAAGRMVSDTDYIALCPGAKWKTKEWLAENYIALAVKIIRDLDMNIALLGSNDDTGLSNEIYKGVGVLKKHITDMTGKTGLRELACLIKKSRLLVTTDSGPMHLGWAVGTRTIALFGPTVKEFGFQPVDPGISIIDKDMECRPCSLHGSNKCKFKDHACMRRIEVYEVMDKIKKALRMQKTG
ncbi:MAG: glycosyltransferase family 9 protein [Elusimicrobiota bacterium]